MKSQLSISESEWQVMKILWNHAPQTLPEILYQLRQTAWSKTTIQTYLARLVKRERCAQSARARGICTIRRHRKAIARWRKAAVFSAAYMTALCPRWSWAL